MQKREFLKGGLAALGGFGFMSAASAAEKLPAAEEINWDETWDTIIVGSGIAATCAGNEALDLGLKKVIMVEKMPVFGGNSAITGFWINVPGTSEQIAHGVKDDSPELFLKDTLKAGEYFNDPKLAHALCFEALDAYNYLIKNGCKFAKTPFIQGGHSKIRSLAPEVSAGISVLIPLHRKYLEKGGVMRKNTIVDEVIKDKDGRAVGVAVRENYVFDINSRDNDLTNKTGVRKYYRATKGIIFGAGGFVNDWRLCSMIDPKITKETEGTNHPGATAGALFTLMRAGGIPVHIDYIQWGPWCSPDDKGIGMGADVCDYIKQYGAAFDPKTGKRCFNELGNRTELTNDIFSLKNEDGSQCFAVLIADSQFVPKVSIARYLNKSLKSGTTKKFETLEELAKFYGIPLEPLKAEIAKYNGWIKEGREFDPDFHRPLTPNEGVLMGKGPWYGHRLTSKLHYTMGGIKINEKAEVIGQDFNPIPGLYAAGEITGGVHGVTRLGGNSVLDGIVFGRIAGRSVAQAK